MTEYKIGEEYHFPCGCHWPVIGPPPREGALPLLDIDDENLPFCPLVWQILAEGDTKGVFQLESQLGRKWTKELKPESGEHIGALGSILRPGCLKAVDKDGVSMTEHYCRRKNGREPVPPYHPSIDPILKPTYSTLAYQEQAIEITKVIGGFSLQDADAVRKACGKKDPLGMAKCKKKFMEGAEQTKVMPVEMAAEVFGWIEKSQRYAFNRCVSQKEVIRRLGTQASLTVGEMYRIYNDLDYARACGQEELHDRWTNEGVYGLGLSMDENERVVVNMIEDIQYAGRRQTFRLTVADGRCCFVTANHKFPTTQGEMTVQEMIELQAEGKGVFLFIDLGGQSPRHALKVALYAIKPDEITDTYDVTMSPPHNFLLGSGIFTCNSHAVSYGLTGYDTAYCKAHCPVFYYANWLRYGPDKADPLQEIWELVQDARKHDVPVHVPDLRMLEPHFQSDGVEIWFGLTDIKGVGEGQMPRMKEAVKRAEELSGKVMKDWEWKDFLFFCAGGLPASLVVRLIKTGALSWLNTPRMVMLDEHDKWAQLTKNEQEWISTRERVARKLLSPASLFAEPAQPVEPEPPILAGEEALVQYKEEMKKYRTRVRERKKKVEQIEERISFLHTISPYPSLVEAMEDVARGRAEGGGVANVKRTGIIRSLIGLLKGDTSSRFDRPDWIAWEEEDLLGVAITCTRVEAFDQKDVNCTCREFAQGRGGYVVLGVQIEQCREIKTKKGKSVGAKMAFLTVSDSTCLLADVVCFPEDYKRYADFLEEGNCVYLQGERDAKKGGLIVKKVSLMEK